MRVGGGGVGVAGVLSVEGKGGDSGVEVCESALDDAAGLEGRALCVVGVLIGGAEENGDVVGVDDLAGEVESWGDGD